MKIYLGKSDSMWWSKMRPGKARQRKVIRRMMEIPIIFRLAFIMEETTGPCNNISRVLRKKSSSSTCKIERLSDT